MVENILKLNVGGRIFETYLTTLKAEPDSALARMFSEPMLPKADPSGAYIIDSSPEHFGAVLNWCRFKVGQIFVIWVVRLFLGSDGESSCGSGGSGSGGRLLRSEGPD